MRIDDPNMLNPELQVFGGFFCGVANCVFWRKDFDGDERGLGEDILG
jgi:hypothetical protein